jgi:hydrogenase maturation protein HypF
MASGTCLRLKKRYSINDVVLSGGVFQNALLTGRLSERLKRLGFNVYTHRDLSTTDAGVSMGQAVIAGAGI